MLEAVRVAVNVAVRLTTGMYTNVIVPVKSRVLVSDSSLDGDSLTSFDLERETLERE